MMMAMVAMMMSMQWPVEGVWPSLGSLCNYSTPQPSPLHFDSKDLRWIYYGWLNIGAIRSIFFCEDNFSHNRLLLCPCSKPAELLHSEPREISVIGQIKKVGQRARGRWSWSNLRSCRCLLKETEGRRVCLRVGGGHHSSNCQSPSAVF